MSAHVLLNLFNELGKSDKCEAFTQIQGHPKYLIPFLRLVIVTYQ